MRGIGDRLDRLPVEKRMYALRELPEQLVAAGNEDRLHHLLMDFTWLDAKLCGTSASELLADFQAWHGPEDVNLLEAALRLSAHVIEPDPTQLAGQLIGRLWGHTIEHRQVCIVFDPRPFQHAVSERRSYSIP